TQVDYISTFYSITIVYYLFLLSEATKPRWDTMTFIGIAVGMGMLTKYVSMIFVAPFALWLGLRFLFTHKIADTIRLAGVVGVVCLICTGGFF
ncbi:glycosyltransferase family 39 protein, partial [Staphylococcus aureus]|nr:glycosyltransferase family 39 protein [Staphylococcus aureus]